MRHIYTPAGLAGTLLLLLPAASLAAGLTGTVTPSMAAGDFDGDTRLDRVFGYPQANGSEGVVKIVYGSQVIEVWNRDSPGVLGSDAAGDYLGDSVAVGDFDGDGYDDLAIGAPGDDTTAGSNVGTITVLYGSSSGITGNFDQLYSQNTPGIANAEESYDAYGEFLQAGDFNCDGYDDLAVGIPQENISTSDTNGGAVNVIYGSSGGLTALNDWFHQDTTDVTGSVQSSDNFGASLLAANFTGDFSGGHACDDLIVGVPGEDIGYADVGAMQLFPGDPSGLDIAQDVWFRQAYQGAEGSREANDEFASWLYGTSTSADGFADATVRVPGDACEPEGMALQVFDGSSSGLNTATDELLCVNVAGGLQALADEFSTCVLETGFCDCSQEFRDAVAQTSLPSKAREPWMCTVKLQAASDFCVDVPAQAVPTSSILALDCIEASEEAWNGCNYGTVEGEL